MTRLPEDHVSSRGSAPVDDTRTARIIDREEQIETIRDAFGEEITKRFIRQRIFEIETKRAGDHNDLAALDDDTMVERFIEHRTNTESTQR